MAKGGRVGILLPQALETALAHLAIYKLGAIAVPLFALFGTEASRFRLSNSGGIALITGRVGLGKLAEIRARLRGLQSVFAIDSEKSEGDCLSFWRELEA